MPSDQGIGRRGSVNSLLRRHGKRGKFEFAGREDQAGTGFSFGNGPFWQFCLDDYRRSSTLSGLSRRERNMTGMCRLARIIVLLGGISFFASVSLAQAPETNRILIDYSAPSNPAHQALYERLKQKGALERIQMLLSPFRLPRPLTIRTAGCDGEINAWFELDSVTVCYEYIEYVFESAASWKRPEWVSEHHAIMGAMIDVFLHEVGHALFDYLDIPIFGREEDAADQFAAYMLLSLGRQDTPQLMAGIIYIYLNEAGVRDFSVLNRKRLRIVDHKQHADVHSLPLQRMYNTLCLAYGANPAVFREAVERGALPADRAESCAEEFQQVEKAFRKLIQPHIDLDVLKNVLSSDTLSLGRKVEP
ncbi:MAG: hypothetical protein INF18_05180 [Methylobacterium sp.]|nr:hypothetical protein [Methylobacterium sp.]MCA3637257.1 hypothetical protein [Methylobacterium sp.]